MATIKKRVQTKEEVLKDIKRKPGEDWQYPGHSKEYLVANIPGKTKEEREDFIDDVREDFKSKGYEELTFSDAVKIFGQKAKSRSTEYSSKKILFFLWKYSQLFKKIEKEHKKVIEKLTDDEAIKIMRHVKKTGILTLARVIAENGEFELCRKGEMVVRDKEGKPIFIAHERRTIAKRDDMNISDLSLRTIKRACEELNIKYPLDKKLDNSKK
jgi:hypothetical protein